MIVQFDILKEIPLPLHSPFSTEHEGVGVSVAVGMEVEVGLGIIVGVGVEAGLGVMVGPRRCRGPHPETRMLIIKKQIEQEFVFIVSLL